MVFGECVADRGDADERRRYAFWIVASALDGEAVLISLEGVRHPALKVEGVGEVLQRFALELRVADAARHFTHALEAHLRGGVQSHLRRLPRAPRERGDELVRDQLGLGQQELLARPRVGLLDEAVREAVDGRPFANESPLATLAHVDQAPRRGRMRREWRTAGNSGGRHAIARGGHTNADTIRRGKRIGDRDVREGVVAGIEHVFQLPGIWTLGLGAPERQIAVHVLGLLHGKEPFDRGAEGRIVDALTASGRQGHHRH